MRLTFARSRPRTALSELPTVFERAALFRPRFVGAWTYWVLLAVVVICVPALLVRALWTARPGPDDPA